MKEILGHQVRTLFDPVQTHAVYGLVGDEVDEVKDALKAVGAVRFRLVKNHYGRTAVCFKIKGAKRPNLFA
jgi:hypothetical protein